MKNTVHIDKKWKGHLKSLGFDDYDSFFHSNPACKRVSHDKTGAVHEITIPGKREKLFLKIKHAGKCKKFIRNLLKGRPCKSTITNEVKNINFLKKLNFDTVNTVAWGTKSQFGYTRSAFMITEQVQGEEFINFYNRSSRNTRNQIYHTFGELLGKLHCSRVDSYVRIQDIICQQHRAGLKLIMIDREVGSRKARRYTIKSISKNFSYVFYEALKRYRQIPMTTKEALIFCKAYLEYNTAVKVSVKELFKILMGSIQKFIVKRKSFPGLAPLLPEKLLKITQNDEVTQLRLKLLKA